MHPAPVSNQRKEITKGKNASRDETTIVRLKQESEKQAAVDEKCREMTPRFRPLIERRRWKEIKIQRVGGL